MRKVINLLIVLLFALSVGGGCASHTKTVRTEAVQYPAETVQHPTETAVVERQTTETTETRGESVGLLSGTVHVVGQVLALPFRLAGGLIGLIF